MRIAKFKKKWRKMMVNSTATYLESWAQILTITEWTVEKGKKIRKMTTKKMIKNLLIQRSNHQEKYYNLKEHLISGKINRNNLLI